MSRALDFIHLVCEACLFTLQVLCLNSNSSVVIGVLLTRLLLRTIPEGDTTASMYYYVLMTAVC